MMKNEKHIACPYCKNKRLFDIETEGTGSIAIKCPICKSIVVIKLNSYVRVEK